MPKFTAFFAGNGCDGYVSLASLEVIQLLERGKDWFVVGHSSDGQYTYHLSPKLPSQEQAEVFAQALVLDANG